MIELYGYKLDQDLSCDDESMMDELLEYCGSTSIEDAIHEVADFNVSIYDGEVFEEASGLYRSGAYAQAKADGLMGDESDALKSLQCAWYQYNFNQLYRNTDELCYNYAATYLNKIGVDLDEDQLDELDSIFTHYNTNNSFDDILDEVNESFVQTAECEVGADD